MFSAKQESGSVHIKYGHYYYPVRIQVVCPNCLKSAALTHICAKGDFLIDYAYDTKTYQLNCNSCLKKDLMSWEGTKALQLLNKISIRNEEIWAWNTNHLEYLIGVFSGHEDKSHDWAFFRNYINKKWLTKTRHPSDILKLKRLLEDNRTL